MCAHLCNGCIMRQVGTRTSIVISNLNDDATVCDKLQRKRHLRKNTDKYPECVIFNWASIVIDLVRFWNIPCEPSLENIVIHSLTHLIIKLNIDDKSAVTVFIEKFLILLFAKFLFFQTRWSPNISNSFLAFPFLPFLILWKLEMSGSHLPGQIVCELHSLTAN